MAAGECAGISTALSHAGRAVGAAGRGPDGGDRADLCRDAGESGFEGGPAAAGGVLRAGGGAAGAGAAGDPPLCGGWGELADSAGGSVSGLPAAERRTRGGPAGEDDLLPALGN